MLYLNSFLFPLVGWWNECAVTLLPSSRAWVQCHLKKCPCGDGRPVPFPNFPEDRRAYLIMKMCFNIKRLYFCCIGLTKLNLSLPNGLSKLVFICGCSGVGLLSSIEKPRLARPGKTNFCLLFDGNCCTANISSE